MIFLKSNIKLNEIQINNNYNKKLLKYNKLNKINPELKNLIIFKYRYKIRNKKIYITAYYLILVFLFITYNY